jgi:hypothetical protein
MGACLCSENSGIPLSSAASGILHLTASKNPIVHSSFILIRHLPLSGLQVGDASGIQSPLSFGGFGALMRHLSRLTFAVKEAVQSGSLNISSLALCNPYNPALSGAWMLQRAMSIPANATRYNPSFINKLLAGNFAVRAGKWKATLHTPRCMLIAILGCLTSLSCLSLPTNLQGMQELGDPVLKPFLQDVIQLGPLTRTLVRQMARDPLFIPEILTTVGPGPMADWMLHYLGLAAFTALAKLSEQWELGERVDKLPPKTRFLLRRAIESWEYGAGMDYKQ